MVSPELRSRGSERHHRDVHPRWQVEQRGDAGVRVLLQFR